MSIITSLVKEKVDKVLYYMRILIDGSSLDKTISGIGNYTYNLLTNLLVIDQSNDYSVIARRWDENILAESNLPINKVSAAHNSYRFLPFDAEKFTGRYDLYHEPNYIPRVFGGKTVVSIHDLSHLLYPQYHPRKRVIKLRMFAKRMCRADGIITDSENSRREIIEMLKVPGDRVAVTYLGADENYRPVKVPIERKLELQKTYNLPEAFFLYVGTIEPRKNLQRLIEAFSLFKKEYLDSDLKLVLAGGKGWLYEGIFAKVRDLHMEREVIFIGYISNDDLPDLYNLALAFVFPSLYEGFGLPPLEAMSCGVPVISSNISSLPEVVGNAGILVDPYRTRDIAEAIGKIASSASLREELSRRGLEQAKKFSWRQCALDTLKVYQECISD